MLTDRNLKDTLEDEFADLLEAAKIHDNAGIEKHARAILDLEKQLVTRDYDLLKAATIALTQVLFTQNRYKEASPVISRTLSVLEEQREGGDISTGTLHHMLAKVCERDGDFLSAVYMYSHSLCIIRSWAGDESPETKSIIADFRKLAAMVKQAFGSKDMPVYEDRVELEKQIDSVEEALSKPALYKIGTRTIFTKSGEILESISYVDCNDK